MTLGILLLGFGLGLLLVIPPGPLAVTLVEVGVSQGRVAGARSGAGIAAGDLTAGAAAAFVVASGAVLPAAVFDTIQLGSALILIGLGVFMVLRPNAVESLADAIQRPGRTFFLLTVFTPTVFGAWLAIIGALPFATDLGSVFVFLLGAALASTAYHVGLGTAAGEFGRHLGSDVMAHVARIGGALFAALGVAMLFA